MKGSAYESLGPILSQKQTELKNQKRVVDELVIRIEKESDRKLSPSKEKEASKIPFGGIMAPVAKTLVIPVKAAQKSVSWAGSAMPKFPGTRDMDVETLSQRRRELKLEIVDLKDKIAGIQAALEEEREESAPEEVSDESAVLEKTDLTHQEKRQLRKKIRSLHRKVRAKYRDVEDRKKHKDQLIEELSREVEEVKQSVGLGEMGKAAMKPVKGAAWLAKSFIFGVPDKEEETIQKADRAQKGLTAEQVSRVSKLKEEIEYEIIMIDTRREEILVLEEKLSAKEAEAKLQGVPSQDLSAFRPDYILKDNFERLGRLIAPKTREEILMNRLERLSEEFNETLIELDAVEKAIQPKEISEEKVPSAESQEPSEEKIISEEKAKAAEEVAAEEAVATPEKTKVEVVAEEAVVASEETVREKPAAEQKSDFEKLNKQYEKEVKKYTSLKKNFESELKKNLSKKGKDSSLKAWRKEEERIEKERLGLIKKRNEIESDLSAIYYDEASAVEEMRSLVREKISMIDSTFKSLRFKKGDRAGDLKEEKQRLQDLLSVLGERIQILRNEEMKLLEPLEVANYA